MLRAATIHESSNEIKQQKRMPNTPPLYTIVLANIDRDREKILALWRRGLTHDGMPDAKFDWYYRNNPAGSPQVFLLCHGPDEEPVGVAAVGRREMRMGAQTIMSGELIDFVALPEHRTLFPALFLQKEIRRLSLGAAFFTDGADSNTHSTHGILYGLPNPKSLAVVKRVGYQLVGQLVRRARILRSAGYLSRHAPAWLCDVVGPVVDRFRLGALAARGITSVRMHSHWLERPDNRFDDLWQRIAQSSTSNTLIGVRNSAFLAWRFSDCPLKKYRFFALFSSSNKQLLAYAVCAADGEALHVHDFLIDPANKSTGKALWIALSREAFRRGHSNISVAFLGAASIQQELESIGMMKRQQRPLYATVATDPGHDGATLLEESSWYLTSADEDG